VRKNCVVTNTEYLIKYCQKRQKTATCKLLAECFQVRSVSCTGNRHPIPGGHAPAVTMIG